MTRDFRLILTGALATVLLFGGCKPSSVSVYDVPKASETAAAHSAHNAASSNAASGEAHWSKPEAWTELAPTSFRKGNYVIKGENNAQAEVTVSSFPGSVGGLLANVNRWRGQAGLSPISEEALAQAVSDIEIDGQSGQLVDILPDTDEPEAVRIIAAIILHQGQSWFFKMSGPQSIVAPQRKTFMEFVDGVHFGHGEHAHAHAETTDSSGPSKRLAFEAPEGWTESSGSSLRLASYQIIKEGFPPADFSITSFPGDAGGIVANVNRWRMQIGLEKWSEQQVLDAKETIQAGDIEFAFYDLRPLTEDEKASATGRILVAITGDSERSWFFKLSGDIFLLETQNRNFRELLLSTRFE